MFNRLFDTGLQDEGHETFVVSRLVSRSPASFKSAAKVRKILILNHHLSRHHLATDDMDEVDA